MDESTCQRRWLTIYLNLGEDVIINTWYNHRNNSIQKIQGDDYTNYNPFRFVGSDRQAARIGDDFLVFGEGKHACP